MSTIGRLYVMKNVLKWIFLMVALFLGGFLYNFFRYWIWEYEYIPWIRALSYTVHHRSQVHKY
jgi:hypothetical protein